MKKTIETRWGPVVVHQTGEKPQILLVPGISLGAESFCYSGASVTLEYPGTGDSPWAHQPSQTYTLEAFVGILREVADKLFPEHPPVAVGHSLGGHVITQALARGWRPAGAVLVAAPPLESMASFAQAIVPLPEVAMMYGARISRETSVQVAKVLTNDRGAWLERLGRYLVERDPAFGPTLWSSFTPEAVANEVETLHSAGVPYLALLGTDDAIIQREYWERQIPPGCRELVAGAGHCPPIEARDWFNVRIDRFFQGLRP